MGHLEFGKLSKKYGLITQSVSPYELKIFKGFFSKGIPRTIRRVREQIFIVSIPALIAYSVYEWAEKEHHHLGRKNPKDFENDV